MFYKKLIQIFKDWQRNLEKFFKHSRSMLPNEKTSKTINLVFKLLLIFVILGVFLAKVGNIYKIPLDKPYFSGEWDEPFAINAGINVLKTKGDPVFYNYGGTSIYPHSLVFYIYCLNKKMVPYYKEMDQKFKNPQWPISRKIYPVKPIYITKVVAYILFILGAALFVGWFSLLLLPVPFWLISIISSSKMMTYMANQMLSETHITFLAGFTTIFFAKAIMEKDINKYFKWVVVTAVLASVTVAVKINSIMIIVLPLSLCWRLVKEKGFTLKRFIMIFIGLLVPYILVNPAVIFNFSSYREWLVGMLKMSETTQSGIWMTRSTPIFAFIKDLYLVNILPSVVVILLIILGSILMIKKNPAAYAGFIFFLLFSWVTITNMTHILYGRHLMFLILPIHLFILFPLIYLFTKASTLLKTLVTLICLIITLWFFPPGQIVKGIKKAATHKFTTVWKKESRDNLVKFVQSNNAVLYFYDLHTFSLKLF